MSPSGRIPRIKGLSSVWLAQVNISNYRGYSFLLNMPMLSLSTRVGTRPYNGLDSTMSIAVFHHGMLYVALSRVTKESNLKVFIDNTSGQGNNIIPGTVVAKNVVDTDVLQDATTSNNEG